MPPRTPPIGGSVDRSAWSKRTRVLAVDCGSPHVGLTDGVGARLGRLESPLTGTRRSLRDAIAEHVNDGKALDHGQATHTGIPYATPTHPIRKQPPQLNA